MRNPYDVLGVPSNASDEEIKKAYRKLSRQYHPDANVNNPNKAQAEERFKEIQQAYQQIMKEKEQGAYGYSGSSYSGSGSAGSYGNTGGYGDFGDFGGFGGFWGFGGMGGQSAYTETDTRMQAAANYINNRHYQEALHVLSEILERNARWYYYSALANYGAGNTVTAREHAQVAVSMEPGNMQYQQLLSQLENGGQWYRNMGQGYGTVLDGSDLCLKLCIANAMCSCCCPGTGFCMC